MLQGHTIVGKVDDKLSFKEALIAKPMKERTELGNGLRMAIDIDGQ